MTDKQPKLTPAMKQFRYFKDKYPDAVLFFRMGDFYETFYEDAKICARVLGLTLTSRSKDTNPIPLAGVPFHAVEGYLKKMIQAGYKVAVCEQVEDPKKAKGVVKRDVVRIVTPGTLTDDVLLEEKNNNFLAAVAIGPKIAAISWVDISTGHFFAIETASEKIIDELQRLSPRECLLADVRGELFASDHQKLKKQISQLTSAIITERPAWYFEPHSAHAALLKQFSVNTLEGFGIDENSIIPQAAGAIIEYLKETQKTALSHITLIKKLDRSNCLQIDPVTLRSLEVLQTMRTGSVRGSLLNCIDETKTAMGGRLIRNWLTMPLSDIEQIKLRQNAVEELTTSDRLCSQLAELLSEISDIERIAARISTRRNSPRDLLSLARSLAIVPALRELLSSRSSQLLNGLSTRCDSMDDLREQIDSAIVDEPPSHLRDGGVIKQGYNANLDSLRNISKDVRSWLVSYQQKQIERTGIHNLKVGYNKVFGYYIELPRSAAEKAPTDYTRKQTLKNAERYITEELHQYQEKALSAHEKSLELEQKLFEELCDTSASFISRLQALAAVIAACDCICCFATISRQRGYVRPAFEPEPVLDIQQGSHPVLAQSLSSDFVPNDTILGGDEPTLAIITGPNMAGKSTYIRQVALLVLLAHTGCFVPASSARIGITDRIFTRVGASDEIATGRSTFMVEMTETANIINNASEKSLVILDEVGRGTSTYDGLSLAWAITEHIARNIKCRTLFATHYHELTELANLFENVKNLNVAVREWMDEVVFLHKILPGGTDKSYGVHVAKLAGIPDSIISRSKSILAELQDSFQKEVDGNKITQAPEAPPPEPLFDQKGKSVLDRLTAVDVDNLTPIEAINLLNEIKNEMNDV
jgi:DNA mismatch repair protein MutS